MANPLDEQNLPATDGAPDPTNELDTTIPPELVEPTQQEQAQEQLQEQAADELKNEAKNQWSQWKERYKQSNNKFRRDIGVDKGVGEEAAGQATKKEVGQAAGQSAKKEATKELTHQAEKQVAKQVTGQVAKQAGVQAGRAVAVAAAPEIGVGILVAIGIALVVIIIFVIIFVIYGLSGKDSGGGLPSYPSTTAQREQATLLAGLSGDKIASNKTVARVIESEKKRYGRIKANAQKFSPSEVSAIEQKITEFTPLLDSILSAGDKEARKKIKDDVQAKMLAFEGTLPFGQWIAAIAKTRVGDPNINFCNITNAPGRLACASFSSTTLWDAGVPNAIVSNTTALWNNKSLRLVIDRAAVSNNDRINESLMKPGDIVWFGHGAKAKKRYAGALFDHVGIYIGNGEIIDTSSRVGNQKIQQRKLTTHRFNGAKRYGKN